MQVYKRFLVPGEKILLTDLVGMKLDLDPEPLRDILALIIVAVVLALLTRAVVGELPKLVDQPQWKIKPDRPVLPW
jgi:hypothetical protein